MKKIEVRSQKSEPSLRDATAKSRSQPRSQDRFRSERGIALILTLAILTLVTLLVIAFAVSMRVENTASKNFNDLIKARQLAQGAVDQAVALLKVGTPLQSDTATTTFWTAPGFALSFVNGVSGPTWTRTLLYSTNNPGLPNDWKNLNDKQQITGINALTPPANSAIYAGWNNVGRNGSEAVSGNPIIGRFAFWVDDEATKVNLNTAWKRDTAGGGPTSTNNSLVEEIDLRALEPPFSDNSVLADAVSSAVHGANPPFTTAEEVKTVTPAIGNPQLAYSANQFFVTVFNGETNVDTWGRARIDLNGLTAAAVSAGSTAYNRLNDDIYKNIYPLSSTRDTFVKKYGPDNIIQILANIVDYHTNATVDATYDALNGLDIPQTYCGLKKGPFLNEITFHAMSTNAITSIVPDSGTPPLLITNWNVFVRVFADVELINPFPDNLGAGYEVVVEPLSISYQIFPGQLGAPHRADSSPVFTNWYPIAAGPPGGAITVTVSPQFRTFPADVPRYDFRSLSATNFSGATVPAPNWQFVPRWENTTAFAGGGILANEAPGVTNVVIQLKRVLLRQKPGTSSSVRDWATTLGPGGRTDLPPSTIPAALLWDLRASTDTPLRDWLTAQSGVNYDTNAVGFAKNDPRMRTFQNVPLPSTVTNWYATSTRPGNYQATPSASNAGDIVDHKTQRFVPGLIPDGSEREVSTQEALERSTFYIKEGNFESPAELGFIHTGIPWRTLRMQSVVPPANSVEATCPSCTPSIPAPSTEEADAIPDWVLLDIFTAGTTPVLRGRLNINSSIFGSNTFVRPTLTTSVLPPRTPSTAALFYGMDNTPLSLPITNSLTPVTPHVTNFWWGTFVANPASGFNPSGLPPPSSPPQPSSQDVQPDTNAMNIAWSHDTNLTQAIRDQYFATSTTPYRLSPLFLTPGEVCEVKGIDNALVLWGTAPNRSGPRKADKELIMRKISNLITTRSNVFTVWAIGQAIIDVDKNGQYDPGTDVISGEVRVQAIVARFVDTSGLTPKVTFRTLYYRYIYE
jgi:hypothetical protein